MFIRELSIKNYKSLEDVHIPGIRNLMVFVGANNAGKTCVLEILRQFPRLHFNQFDAKLFGVTQYETNRTIEVGVTFEIEPSDRRRILHEMTTYGLRSGLEITPFFSQLKLTFMTRPDGMIFGNVFCPVSGAITDEAGNWLTAIETDIPQAIAQNIQVRSNPNASRVVSVGRLEKDWFQTIPSARRPPFESRSLDAFQNPMGIQAFYYQAFLQYCSKVRFLDSRYSAPDAISLSGTLNLTPVSDNLPSVFHTLHSGEEDKFEELSEFVRELVPDIERLRVPVESTSTGLEFETHKLRLRLSQVGSGIGKALAVAYQALMTPDGGLCVIEEPETHLHPSAQRTLLKFLRTQSETKQIAISTHSPAIAGAVERNDLFLVTIAAGVSRVSPAGVSDTAFEIARALGVHPNDQITTDSVVAFVDGISDERIIRAFAEVLWKAKVVGFNLNHSNVAILPLHGQGNLNFLVNTENLANLKKVFLLVADSDKKAEPDDLSEDKRRVIERVKAKGGTPFVWRKREIENYLHPAAVARVLKIDAPTINAFTDVKLAITGLLQKEKSKDAEYAAERHGAKIARAMTADEILAMCRFEVEGKERFEVVDLINAIGSFFPKPATEAAVSA